MPGTRAFAALLAFALTLGAQPPERKDSQSSIEPRSGPGAGQKFLEKFVGTWDVAKSFHPRTGAPVKQSGECVQTMIHGGRFLKSEFTFGKGEARTTGTGLIGFEPDNGVFTSVWTDSRQTRMSFRQGKDKFNGEEIVLFGQQLGDAKEARKSRTVTRWEDDGKVLVHRQYGIAADGSERLVMELRLTRRPAGAAERP